MNFVKKKDFNEKQKIQNITLNKTKHLLVEIEFKKLQKFYSSLFIGQSYFNNNGSQNCLIFQPLYYTLKRLVNIEKIVSWKSRDLSRKKLTTSFITNNSLSPTTKCHEDLKFCFVLKGSCLKQKKM